MRTVLKISGILSWFNLVVWGILTAYALLVALGVRSPAFLLAPFLLSVIILHSYAAIQLHRSIRDPNKTLSSQTPVGIRFIGIVALFFGISWFAQGIALVQNPKEALDLIQSSFPQAKNIPAYYIRVTGVFGILCGACISINVILNFRLLRWYHFMKGMM